VTVAPGVVFSLPGPATLGRSVEARQLVTVHHGDETFVFETSISVMPARLLVVGTDTLGRRAMTIEWTGDELKVDTAPWVPPELRARNVLADIMLVHWPEDAVRAGLDSGAAMRVAGAARIRRRGARRDPNGPHGRDPGKLVRAVDIPQPWLGLRP
jgi:hypothetical protein